MGVRVEASFAVEDDHSFAVLPPCTELEATVLFVTLPYVLLVSVTPQIQVVSFNESLNVDAEV